MLFLVRHAKAGQRDDNDPHDDQRELTTKGWAQAHALVEPLIAAGATTVVASPFIRCRQTVQPLADALGGEVAIDDRLAEDQPFSPVLALLSQVPDGTVLCSHGDVIPETVSALIRRGCRLTTEPNWQKASVWLLDRDSDGAIVTAASWPPPHVLAP
ncbi:MAG TPA: phosphoglycerate mutase family protein [Ilumatobacteraceae bacterium]|nr:phosphoglycerate mutase family protein [Ilumatobacteraceae bacterium]